MKKLTAILVSVLFFVNFIVIGLVFNAKQVKADIAPPSNCPNIGALQPGYKTTTSGDICSCGGKLYAINTCLPRDGQNCNTQNCSTTNQ